MFSLAEGTEAQASCQMGSGSWQLFLQTEAKPKSKEGCNASSADSTTMGTTVISVPLFRLSLLLGTQHRYEIVLAGDSSLLLGTEQRCKTVLDDNGSLRTQQRCEIKFWLAMVHQQ